MKILKKDFDFKNFENVDYACRLTKIVLIYQDLHRLLFVCARQISLLKTPLIALVLVLLSSNARS